MSAPTGSATPQPPVALADRSDATQRYLELMKGCLTFLLWDASDGPVLEMPWRRPLYGLVRLWRRLTFLLGRSARHEREGGMDWPAAALTMIGKTRLDHLQECIETAVRQGVPGDLIETGVWRGGAVIFMRAVLAAHGVRDRTVWVADSFAGLPVPDTQRYPSDRGFDLSMWRSLAVSLDEVRANFERFRLLDDQVRFLEGWFRDTLPHAPMRQIAVLRLDGDLYESTMDALVHLYPKVAPGGYVIVDDYYCSKACREAVGDYRTQHGITEELVTIDSSCVYWKRA